jgi:hypothetical protein
MLPVRIGQPLSRIINDNNFKAVVIEILIQNTEYRT